MKKRSILLYALIALMPATLIEAMPQRHPVNEPAPVVVSDDSLLRTATITASGHSKDRTPQLAIDGCSNDPAAHWACVNLPAVLDADLGKETSIGALRVWPFWGDGCIYKYQVEGSTDLQKWTVLADHTANSITATPDGDTFLFEQKTVRYLRLTVLDSSKHKAGAHIVEWAAYASVQAELQGGVVSIDARPPQTGTVSTIPATDGITLTAWRGERVNAQVVVSAEIALQQLRIDPLTFTTKLAGAKSIVAEPRFVRYVLADGKPQADIIDTAAMITQGAGINRPVWVAIDVPHDAVPGPYQGTLTVRAENGSIDFPIRLEVLAATLPVPKNWSFHLDIWQHPQAVARWHDVPLWSSEHFALLKPLMKRLADAGQKNITCNIIHEPWNAQTFDWFPTMVDWRRKADGTWYFDYTIFDRWVAFMMNEVGITGQIVCYTMIPWHLQFRYYDEATQRFIDFKATSNSSEYDEHWGRFLRDFTVHLKVKGWLGKTAIGIDERPDELLRPALQVLSTHAPDLRVVSAVGHPSSLTQDVYDLSPYLNQLGSVSSELLAKRKSDGKITTFYVACNPKVPNTFTFSPPAESAWLPLLSAAQGYDGFLRWAYNSWVVDPLASTDFVSWPTGDCFLVYPGNRSSVRWERLRDGIEEFEKIRLLRARKEATLDTALADALKVFTVERSSQAGVHEADVRQVGQVVEQLSRTLR